jgi:Fic family protein
MTIDLDKKSKQILELVRENPRLSSSEIHGLLKFDVELITTKRKLSKLVKANLLTTVGIGRGTKYIISATYKLFFPININTYFTNEVDERQIINRFNLNLISDVLPNVSLFTKDEFTYLNSLQNSFKQNISQLSQSIYVQELERLAVDLSWKSSQIEGNTYSLLETEQLIKQQKEAVGKSKDEAIMLLNHKVALDFIIKESDYIDPLSNAKIESIHSLLVKDLGIDANIRKRLVGITGTNYKPLDNEFQIREALDSMCKLVNKRESVFEKAFLLLLLISYIQPFSDGNKRTARIISNAILIKNGYCPLSFRTVDAIEYKKALLLFYEQNNIQEFKKIFISQFEFAVNTYFL